MKLKLFLLTSLYTLFAGIACPAELHLRHTHISTANGLPTNYIYDIVQDADGFVWIGGTGGLSAYDGWHFRNFTNMPVDNTGRTMTPGVMNLLMDKENNLLWVQSTNFVFFCYDISNGCFRDYTGRDDTQRMYRAIVLGRNGTAWMFQDVNGVRRVKYAGGQFACTDYTLDNRKLPGAAIRLVNPTADGGAWLSGDNGIVFVDSAGTSRIVAGGFRVRRCVETGGLFSFFTSRNDVVVCDGKGKMVQTLNIPRDMGRVTRVTGSVTLKGKTHVFTDRGMICLDPRGMTLTRSHLPEMGEGAYYGHYGSCHVVINRRGELYILDNDGGLVLNRQLLRPEDMMEYFGRTFSVVADSENMVYIATNGNGLFVFDPADRSLSHYLSTDKNPLICSDNLQYAMVDRENNLWLATKGNGIICLAQGNSVKWKYLLPAPADATPAANMVRAVVPVADSLFYVSTYNHKNYVYSIADSSFVPQPEYGDRVLALLTDRYGHSWVGTNDGLFIDGRRYPYDRSTRRAAFNKADFLIKDSMGRVWIGARDYGLFVVQAKKDYGDSLAFGSFLDFDAGVRTVTGMQTDGRGQLWVATAGGLFVVDTKRKDITAADIRGFTPENSPLPGYDINSLCVAGSDVWCGLRAGGVLRCKFDSDYTTMTSCSQFTIVQGLASNNVHTIQPDKDGNMWLGTESGMSIVNTRTNGVQTLVFSQDVNENFFVNGSSALLPDGRLMFGTGGGLLLVEPSETKAQVNCGVIRPRFTDMFVNGSSVYDEFRTVLRQGGDGACVELPHDRNSFTVCFSTMCFSSANTTTWQYWLEGYDRTWQPMTGKASADYAQLEPGSYLLHVKALVDNEWSEEATLAIRVLPPWYSTWYAWLLYICVAAAVVFYTLRHIRIIYRLRQHVAEERRKTEMEKMFTDYKIHFFTNISHEFRTPLTIIRGTMERLKQLNRQGDMKQPLDTMQRSTDRMLRLVNQFLEFRKMQQGKLKLALREDDIIIYVQNIYMDFHEIAEEKEMNYTFRTSVKSLRVPFDAGKVDKIVYNLLSNAFKYTQRKGEVTVMMKADDEWLRIIVEDNGVGVPDELKDQLFTRYMESSRVVKDSLGIGLTLTAELIRTHHGTISYTAREGGGSVFTVSLPVDVSVYDKDDFMVDSGLFDEKEGTLLQGFEQVYREMQADPLNEATVMVVEDDGDVAAYISQTLAPYFRVVTVGNGVEALERLAGEDRTMPDLIVSDVMMPQMDGRRLTERLRKDERLRHIPVILLTALTGQEEYLKGISAGADLYLQKPFSPSVLVAHALQIVNRRMHAKSNGTVAAAESGKVQPKVVVKDIRDKNFMPQIDEIISAHIGDDSLSVETLVDGLGIGRSKLFEKMKALLNTTPRDYIQKRRMERAAELLKEGSLNIAEIAYKTGFGHPPYFTRVFKKYYGVTPTEYINGKTGKQD